MELLDPGGHKFKSGIIEGFIFLFFPLWVSFYSFQAYQKSDANPLKQRVSVNNKGHNKDDNEAMWKRETKSSPSACCWVHNISYNNCIKME